MAQFVSQFVSRCGFFLNNVPVINFPLYGQVFSICHHHFGGLG